MQQRSTGSISGPASPSSPDGSVVPNTAVGPPFMTDAAEAARFRPLLDPALRRVWRDPQTLQLGLDPVRAVVIEGVDPPLAGLLRRMDGHRSWADVRREADQRGLEASSVEALLTELYVNGALLDAGLDAHPGQLRPDRAALTLVTSQLGPDRAALSLRVGEAAGAVLAGRADARIVVHGGGRVGVTLATLLAAAGIRWVSVADDGRTEPADCAPGGLRPEDIGQPVRIAAAGAIRRADPAAEAGGLDLTDRPHLVVIADTAPLLPGLRETLHNSRVPHLLAGVRETTGVIGPLVVPGQTSCLRCADLHRADRDSAWPVVAAQLVTPNRRRIEPCDLTLAAATAALGAAQVLSYLDGFAPVTVDGTLELDHIGATLRRRSWTSHPRCGCRYAAATAAPVSTAERAVQPCGPALRDTATDGVGAAAEPALRTAG